MNRLVALVVVVLSVAFLGADAGVTTVEPADLTKRPDLVGREIATDDRVRLFQFHKGEGYDEIYLKRTTAVFRLPKRLRPDHPPSSKDYLVLSVRGVLGRDGDHWHCDVTAFEPLPKDLDRLNQGIANLNRNDFETRLVWARWAEKRAKDFGDNELRERAKELEGESIRIESLRTSDDPARSALALAERARSRGVAEPEPSALAHRGFRKLAASQKSAQDLAQLRDRIAAFFPLRRPESFCNS